MSNVNRVSKVLFKTYIEDGEDISLIVHKHIITLIRPVVVNTLAFIIIPVLFWYAVPKLALIAFAGIIIGLWRLTYKTIAWYFNTLIVTNLNLIDITWNGFFDRSAIRIEYNQIESFSYSVTGFFNTIINCGDIIIAKNSGTEVPVPNIFKVKKKTQTLTQLQDGFMTGHQHRQTGAVKDILTSMLEQHILEHGLVIDDE